jgi:hypothetical protein
MRVLQQGMQQLSINRNNENARNTLHVRPPKPDFFEGNQRKEKVELWVFAMERYFTAVEIQGQHKVAFAASFLRHNAATWWRARTLAAEDDPNELMDLGSWDGFKEALLKQFKPLNSAKVARDRLHSLRQTGSVIELTHYFNTLCADVPNMTEEEKMDKFRRACKPSIQQRLELEDPETLFEMQAMAQRLDEIMWKFQNQNKSSSSRKYQPSFSNRNPNAMQLDAVSEEDDEQSASEEEGEDEDEEESLEALSKRPRRPFKNSKSNSKKPMNYNEKVRCMQSGLCFKCKKAGHRIRECPLWKNLKGKAQ